MSIDNTAVVTEIAAADAAEAKKKAAPVLSREQQDVADLLDALHALRKNPEGRASQVLREELVPAIVAAGGTVARGNTLYIVQDGQLVTIDLTPGSLVRV